MTPAEWEQARGYVCRRYAPLAGDEAEDIAQTACLRSLAAEQRGQTIHPGYVARAAHTILIDEWRKRSRVKIVPAGNCAGLVDSFDMDVEVSTRLDTDALLSGYRPRQRRVLELYAEGCRAREIAEQLGVSVNAVKKIVYRIRRHP